MTTFCFGFQKNEQCAKANELLKKIPKKPAWANVDKRFQCDLSPLAIISIYGNIIISNVQIIARYR